jgi:hypothetical protein
MNRYYHLTPNYLMFPQFLKSHYSHSNLNFLKSPMFR